MSVVPAIPATARVSAAVGTASRPAARRRLGDARQLEIEHGARSPRACGPADGCRCRPSSARAPGAAATASRIAAATSASAADDRRRDVVAARAQPLDDQRAGAVVGGAGGDAGRRDDHDRGAAGVGIARASACASGCSARSRVQWPCLPPDFSSRRMSPSTAARIDRLDHVVQREPGDRDRGERLHLDAGLRGHRDRRGDADGCLAAARTRSSPTPAAAGARAGSARSCASRRRCPAMRAVASTSAFGSPSAQHERDHLGGGVEPPAATATRRVTAFAPTSIMRARPSSSRWLSSLIGPKSPPRRRPAGRRRPRARR